MDQTSVNRDFVKRHFEAVNRRDVPTVLRNMRPDLYDHELPGDHKNDLQRGAQRLQVLMIKFRLSEIMRQDSRQSDGSGVTIA